MNSEPARPAAVPDTLIPPLIPRAMGRQVSIDRGATPNNVPISVDHVSADAAASAPMPASAHGKFSPRIEATANSMNNPPLANTCVAVRWVDCGSVAIVNWSFSFARQRVSAVDVRKNAINNAAHGQPTAVTTTPIKNAAHWPETVSDPRCLAQPVMMPAMIAPIRPRMISAWSIVSPSL